MSAISLYCWQHNTVHRFVPIDVERIVYTLTAAEADASTDTDSPLRGEDSYEHLRCPQEVLSASRDGEQYGEHVEQGLEGRRRADRERSAS